MYMHNYWEKAKLVYFTSFHVFHIQKLVDISFSNFYRLLRSSEDEGYLPCLV